jgi:hypothetical protein
MKQILVIPLFIVSVVLHAADSGKAVELQPRGMIVPTNTPRGSVDYGVVRQLPQDQVLETAVTISLPEELRSFDLDGDGKIDDLEEEICKRALDVYCKNKNVTQEHMLNILQQYRSSRVQPRVASAASAAESSSDADSHQLQFSTLLLHSLTDALEKTQNQHQESEQQLSESVTKTKAAGATFVTALTGLAVTLLVHYLGSGKGC